MDFFSRGYNALRGDVGQPQSATDTIDKLCDRLESATLLEDRRASILALKGLARQYKKPVSRALDALLLVVANDAFDNDLLKATLETITLLCTQDRKDDPVDTSVDNVEHILATPEHVSTFLSTLSNTDFYVRFTTLQLLSTIQSHRPAKLQERVLVTGLGISRMMDMLDEKREIIRNEALLLLIALSEQNAEIQKIVAFENAFDRLLFVVNEEGGPSNGGIVVQDCLQLIMNLLKYNVSNQTISSLLSFPFNQPLDWSDQAAVNMNLVLDILRVLVVPGSTNTAPNQKVMGVCVLPAVLMLAVGGKSPASVIVKALYVTGDIIKNNSVNQTYFGDYKVSTVEGKELGALEVVIRMAIVNDVMDHKVRIAAIYAFESQLANHVAAQEALASLLAFPPTDPPENGTLSTKCNMWVEWPESVGHLIVFSLINTAIWKRDILIPWFAASILLRILGSSEQVKAIVLNVTFGDVSQGEELVPLMHSVCQSLHVAQKDTMDVRVSIGLLSLLCVWLDHSPSSVTQFLGEGVNLQNLIEWISHASGVDPLIQGLSAYLLGIVYEYNEDKETPFSRASLQPILLSRIGMDQFTSHIGRLRESQQFQLTGRFHQAVDLGTDGQADFWFDPYFVEFFKTSYDTIQKSIGIEPKLTSSARKDGLSAAMDSSTAELVAKYKQDITRQQQEIEGFKKQVSDLTEKLSAATKTLPPPPHDDTKEQELMTKIAQLEQELVDQRFKFTTLEKEQEDLLVFLADQDAESKRMRHRLRALGDTIPDSDDEDAE